METTMPSDVQIFDVLFSSESLQEAPNTMCLAPKEHTGNRRFLVTLETRRHDYEIAHEFGNEESCDNIASEIVNIICHHCEPRGRFLHKVTAGTRLSSPLSDGETNSLKSGNDLQISPWRDLGDGDEARNAVKLAFNSFADPLSFLPPSIPCTVINLINPEKAQTIAQNIHLKRKGINEQNSYMNDALGWKIPHVLQKATKRPINKGNPQKQRGKYESLKSFDHATESKNIGLNDVLCGGSGEGVLATNNSGNQRLRHLVKMHRNRYEQGDKTAKFSVVCDIVSTVMKLQPPGRFLFQDQSTMLWHELNVEKAWAKTLRAFRSSRLSVAPMSSAMSELDKIRSSTAQELISRRRKKKAASQMGQDQIERIQNQMRKRSNHQIQMGPLLLNAAAC